MVIQGALSESLYLFFYYFGQILGKLEPLLDQAEIRKDRNGVTRIHFPAKTGMPFGGQTECFGGTN